MLSKNAIKYTLQHLFEVAFPKSENLNFEIVGCSDFVCVKFQNLNFRFYLFDDSEWKSFVCGNSDYVFVDNASKSYKIPVFSNKNASNKISFTEDSSAIIVPFDVISTSFALLSRYEESINQEVDEHERFRFSVSIVSKYNIAEIPLVDEYAMLLRKSVLDYFPNHIKFLPRNPQIILTHDIDILYRFSSPIQAAKSIFGRDLLINRSLSNAFSSWKVYKASKSDKFLDPYVDAIFRFQEIAKNLSLKNIFFFKALKSGEFDSTYDISDDFTIDILRKIIAAGGQIGIHGSYQSAADPQKLKTEISRLEEIVNQKVTKSRQHYLRTSFSEHHNSIDVWQFAEISDDYSLGFAEHCGFKCGTAHPFYLFDLKNDTQTSILEHPLIVMDGTLFDYMNLNHEDAYSLTLKLLSRTFATEGDFVILWHNHTTTRNYKRYFEEVFLKIINNK